MPQDSQGRYYESAATDSAKALASTARTTTGTGTPFAVEDITDIEGTLSITAASGTSPTLDVRLETTVDGTNYYTVGSFAQKTTTSTEAKAFGPLGNTARWAWTIGGTTPSFTFSTAAKTDRDN